MQIICLCGKGINLDGLYVNVHDVELDGQSRVPIPKGTWKIARQTVNQGVTCKECGASIAVSCTVNLSRFDARKIAGEGLENREQKEKEKEKGKQEEKSCETRTIEMEESAKLPLLQSWA